MSTQVFAVFRQGVGRHECGGIFTALTAATACADMLAESDTDAYHCYQVVPFWLGEQTPRAPAGQPWLSPAIHENEPVYQVSKT